MAGYQGNRQYQAPEQQHKLVIALNWLEAKCSTTEVRNRFETLKNHKNRQHNCVWTNKTLNKKYAIDHCMPFTRWPNNDLWNLLPSDVKAKGQKSDCLPTELKMKSAKQRITNWWQDAWLNESPVLLADPLHKLNQQRFFAEANIALPGLSANNHSVDNLFEALLHQRGSLKGMQQFREW